MITVIIPTFGRPERIPALRANVHADTGVATEVIFVCEADDEASIGAAGPDCVLNTRSPSYSGAVNTAFELSSHLYVFLAADDVLFHPNWGSRALQEMTGWTRVVGTNDYLNPYTALGYHATHYLIDRRYIENDGGVIDQPPGIVLNEDYTHNFCDTEFIGTAKARARFKPCLESVVEHRHWINGKNLNDATYIKNERFAAQDASLYESRKTKWQDLSR